MSLKSGLAKSKTKLPYSQRASKSTLSKEVIYFNEATTSWPKAPGVLEAVNRAIAEPPTGTGRGTGPGADFLLNCRKKLATLLGISDTSRIVLTQNATHALNLAIAGLHLDNGARVVTTCAEHNSVLRPLYHLRRQGRIHLKVVGLTASGDIDTEEFREELKHDTRLVVMTHASNVTGRIFDVRTIFALAKAMGAMTLLDASQSVGHIPVWPNELCADMVAFPGHKGLRGPAGSGGLYVAPHIELAPVIVGGTGVRSESLLQPREMPICLEAGTPCYSSFAGLCAALCWRERLDANFHSTGLHLAAMLHTGLSEIPGVRLCGDFNPEHCVPVISFRVFRHRVEEVGAILATDFNLVCRTGIHCAPLMHRALGTRPEGTVRFSLSGFNTEKEVNLALKAVAEIAATRELQQPAETVLVGGVR